MGYRVRVTLEDIGDVGEPIGRADVILRYEVDILAPSRADEDEDDADVRAGSAAFYVIKLGTALNNHVNAFDACDDASQELLEFAQAVLDPATGQLGESLALEHECIGGDLMIIDFVHLLPDHRGQGVALDVVERLIELYCDGLVVCRPCAWPLGLDVPEGTKPALAALADASPAATQRVCSYCMRAGFRPIGAGDFYILSTSLLPARAVPEPDEHRN